MNIVWFKKDLRTYDHAPLAESLQRGKTIGIFIFEKEWLESAEFDFGHLKFALESIQELRKELEKKGIPLLIRCGSALSTFQDLNSKIKITALFSHEETGLDWTYKRDLNIKKWAKENSIPWSEYRQFGVIRKLKNRDTWSDQRKKIIERPPIFVSSQEKIKSPWDLGELPLEAVGQVRPLVQKGGRSKAVQILDSFLSERGQYYIQSISSPLRAFNGCSRLSPHIAWGTISLTEINAAIQAKRRSFRGSTDLFFWENSLKHFESRLAWHCHFIQKLETEPEIEFKNFNQEFDGLRGNDFNESYFNAWCKGETGFPMIDACMRALHTYGWINFRMRAMLMSFASYQLWLHWKKPAEYLARQFIDFEPGIHYSQAQMQSGVTGINSIRIYSPKKQALEQDPNGEFIKKFIPELEQVPLADLAEPHKMPPILQLDCGYRPGETYPLPIVDPEESYKNAKEKIFKWKKLPHVQAASKKVYHRHGSRNGANTKGS